MCLPFMIIYCAMSNLRFISDRCLARRTYWIGEIEKISGDFGADARKLEKELADEIARDGEEALVDHLRLCGAIPERYGHDTSEEKLYSKYTDVLLAEAFGKLGVTCTVIQERADSADVEGKIDEITFVADAKAFRLSRTAKNQKDFKVQAMDIWRRDKEFSILVCPFYQLPARASQIYAQAIARNVCILTYSHLAVLVRHHANGGHNVIKILHAILSVVRALQPTKNAASYWIGVNGALLRFGTAIELLWREEKLASLESIAVVKEEALRGLSEERTKILSMSREEAIKYLLEKSKFRSKEAQIRSITDNGLLDYVK
jgi:type II restriction enzyme